MRHAESGAEKRVCVVSAVSGALAQSNKRRSRRRSSRSGGSSRPKGALGRQRNRGKLHRQHIRARRRRRLVHCSSSRSRSRPWCPCPSRRRGERSYVSPALGPRRSHSHCIERGLAARPLDAEELARGGGKETRSGHRGGRGGGRCRGCRGRGLGERSAHETNNRDTTVEACLWN